MQRSIGNGASFLSSIQDINPYLSDNLKNSYQVPSLAPIATKDRFKNSIAQHNSAHQLKATKYS